MSCDDLFAGCEAVQHHIRSIGYGLGTAWNWLWACLEMSRASRRVRRIGNIAALCICLPVAVVFLAKTTQWQNSIRAVMSMEPITGTLPIQICLIALASFAVLLMLGRLFRFAALFLAQRLLGFMPRRVALVAGVTLTTMLVWSLSSGVMVRTSFRMLDALIEPALCRLARRRQRRGAGAVRRGLPLPDRAAQRPMAARGMRAEMSARDPDSYLSKKQKLGP